MFIVGSPRSGTSILINGLRAAGYKGFLEGNFLTLLRHFEVTADRHKATYGTPTDQVLAGSIDWEAFKDDIFQVFKKYLDNLNPPYPWADKTGNPPMIQAIPQILKLWPEASFIFAKRRGIENVISRLKKFPALNFEFHCREWERNMAAWRAVRDNAGVRGIEIDQQEIARMPDAVAAKLTAFLDAGADACGRMGETFRNERPQQSDENSAERVVGLDNAGWTPDQRSAFSRICCAEMKYFDYASDENYWADAGPITGS